ncbi:voltage-gated potassium channel [Halopelagius inordinatus]|uniref:Voltage-gated potassium channel n=1 Tax=Halopelagius inordinatus TaxID=553467 RepID=A0A1I2STM7_9EURY|nr:ion transporter [Halopelagius inordinatus]SFG56185.1 voltage-gated potassium channel [Halopelagius inordinatus]
MGGQAYPSEEMDLRETVRFYLLDHRTRVGKAIDVALLLGNLLFVGIVVAETYLVSAETRTVLWRAEVGIAVLFLAEYLLRLYGARDTAAEFLSPYTVVDLLAILPTFAVLLLPTPLAASIGFLRVLRVVRILRFFRFTQNEEFFFGTVSVETLRVMKLLLTVMSIFFVSAGLFYSVERGANPNVSNFGDAFYFAVVGLTTVGFGDIVPVTSTGRLVTVVSILAAIVLVPWQASKIVREWSNKEKVNVTCPNCGLSHHDPDASHCKSCGHVVYQEYDSRR